MAPRRGNESKIYNMAKYRHRIFEMYDFRDEAVEAVKPNSAKAVTDSSVPVSGTFRHLSVSRCDNVTLVQFRDLTTADNKIAAHLRDDFHELAENLGRDSKVVLDFSGIDLFEPACGRELQQLSKKLQMKGSRIVLCSLSPNVRASFFTEDVRSANQSVTDL